MVGHRSIRRFSIRTLLIGLVFLAVPLAWFSSQIRQGAHDRELFRHLGNENIEFGATFYRGDYIRSFPGPTFHDRLFERMESLSIHDAELTRDDFALIGKCRDLKHLSFFGTRFDPECLQELHGLSLREIVFTGCPIGDEAVAQLPGIPSLEWASLDRTEITDRAFEYLDALPHLTYVQLDDTKISLDGLRSFSRLKQLNQVSVSTPPLTRDEYLELQAMLPNTIVDYVEYSHSTIGPDPFNSSGHPVTNSVAE